MKTRFCIFLLTFLMLTISRSNGQDGCGTPHDLPNISYYENNFAYDDNPICVNVWFHILRNTNGTGGYSVANLNSIIQLLNNKYNSHNILFNLLGYDEINNSNYITNDFISSNSKFNSIIGTNSKTNALNIYLGASDDLTLAGRANSIPGYAVLLSSSRINTSYHAS